jgi:hypothetical protein
MICPACDTPFELSITDMERVNVSDDQLRIGFFGGRRGVRAGSASASKSQPDAWDSVVVRAFFLCRGVLRHRASRQICFLNEDERVRILVLRAIATRQADQRGQSQSREQQRRCNAYFPWSRSERRSARHRMSKPEERMLAKRASNSVFWRATRFARKTRFIVGAEKGFRFPATEELKSVSVRARDLALES